LCSFLLHSTSTILQLSQSNGEESPNKDLKQQSSENSKQSNSTAFNLSDGANKISKNPSTIEPDPEKILNTLEVNKTPQM